MNIKYIDGYHGTYLESLNNILNNGFTYKQNDEHWLGQGFYFYAEKDLAQWWITKKVDREESLGKPKRDIAVIKVNICSDINNILNLDNPFDFDKFLSFVSDYLEEMKQNNVAITLDKNEIIKNRCFFLDLMKKAKNMHVVISTFSKDYPSYGKYDIRKFKKEFLELGLTYKETQICVSRNNCIISKQCVFPVV